MLFLDVRRVVVEGVDFFSVFILISILRGRRLNGRNFRDRFEFIWGKVVFKLGWVVIRGSEIFIIRGMLGEVV